MELIINSLAARSSLGVRRLFAGIMRHLEWDSAVSYTPVHSPAWVARGVELLQRGRPDAIYWSPTHRGPLWAHHHVVSIHDCINVEFIYRDDWRLPVFRRMFNIVLANAEVVVALSNATKAAALRNYSLDASKIVVIPAGFDMPEVVPAAGKSKAEPPFILIVTNSLPHKNSLRACRAFLDSNAPGSGYELRVVGSLPLAARELLTQRNAKIKQHERIEDALLQQWYVSAAFLLSPSLAEGYNLPIAEAIASGANVLCSDIAVHREFFEGQATFFDPTSEDAIVEAINDAILRSETRWYPDIRHLRMRSFKDVANDYRAVFRSVERSNTR